VLRGACPLLCAALTAAPAAAAEEQAFVLRETAAALPNGLGVDHGGFADETGRRWVAVRGEAEILDVLPVEWVRARRAIPVGPPPDGVALPEGVGRSRFDAAVAAAPRAEAVVLGWSHGGRDIVAAWFGQPPEAGAPSLWVLGGHHGDEVAGYEAAVWLAERLSEGDAAEPSVRELLDHRTVWVVPWVNPDGVMDATRYNGAGVDLNRNYGVEWSSREQRAGSGPFSEPESQAMRRLGGLVRPAAGLALHSGAVNVGYVWNHTESPAPDAPSLVDLATSYAATCSTEDFYVTNGAAWYVTHGDSNDWSYGRFGTWEFTVELSKRKLLEPEAARQTVGEHEASLWAFVLQPIDEVVVQDALTGAPLEAWARTPTGQARWGSAATGRIGLVGAPGVLEVGAPGYRTVEARPGDVVALEPVSVAPGVADPPWVRPVRQPVHLPGAGATRVLSRVGEEPVRVDVDPFGRSMVPAGRLATGWWTVEDATGAIFPRAMGVGAEPVDRWPATSPGARAFTLGVHRELVEIAVEPEGTPLVREAVWLVDAAGEQLLVADAAAPEELWARGAGCASIPQTGHLGLGWVSIFLGWARRRREETW